MHRPMTGEGDLLGKLGCKPPECYYGSICRMSAFQAVIKVSSEGSGFKKKKKDLQHNSLDRLIRRMCGK